MSSVSPLRWFRKHSMFFMVVFGIGAMVIFGLGSVVGLINPNDMNGQSGADEVVATWRDGKVTRSQLQMMQGRHFQAHRFLQGVYEAAVKEKGGEGFRPTVNVISSIRRDLNEAQFDEQVLQRHLLAQKAKDEGFLINDQMVYDYISQIAGNAPFSRNDFRSINREVNFGKAALETVVQTLKSELLFQQVMVMTGGGMPTVPNATESVQFYDRTHRQVVCKIMDFPVDEYIEKVTEEAPTSELKAIFKAGRYEYPDGVGEVPGFKARKKVRLKYFAAKRDTFLENEMNKLTAEEIQKEYERLVELEDNMVMEVVPQEKEEDKGPALNDGGSELPGSENGEAGESTEGEAPAPPEAPALPQDSAVKDLNEVMDMPNKPKEGEVPLEGPGAEEAPGEGGQSSVVRNLAARYASMQDVPPQETPVEQVQQGEIAPEGQVVPEGEAILEGGVVAEEGTAPKVKITPDDGVVQEMTLGVQDSNEPASGNAAESTDAAPAPPAAPTVEVKQAPAGSGITVTPADDPDFKKKPEIERRPKPLKDCLEQIKRSMKSEAASNALKAALDGAENKIRLHQMMYGRWESRPQNDESKPVPSEPDYKAIADEFGLEFNETDLIDRTEMADETIGQIVSFEFSGGRNRRPTQFNVGDRIFDQYYDTTLYAPNRVDDFRSGATYLYFVTEKKDQEILSYADALPKVKEFWKRKTGVERARAAAQEIATKINNQPTNMIMINAEKTIDTGEFSWFSNQGGGGLDYGTPTGVINAGDEFMETVFELELRKAGVATNDSRDHVYAIQLIKESESTTDSIGDEYLNDQFFKFKRQPADVSSLSGLYMTKLNEKWRDNFVEDMELKWVAR